MQLLGVVFLANRRNAASYEGFDVSCTWSLTMFGENLSTDAEDFTLCLTPGKYGDEVGRELTIISRNILTLVQSSWAWKFEPSNFLHSKVGEVSWPNSWNNAPSTI